MSSEFEKVSGLNDNDWLMDRFKKRNYEEDKDAFDEGISVSESNIEDDEGDDEDYDFPRQPKNEFEKCLSKIDSMTRQIDEDTQFLSHDLKTLQTKNESTERRILKLLKQAEEFKYKLRAFLQSYQSPRGGHEEKEERSHKLERIPSYQATLHVLLKPNSIEQPIHVNIAMR